MADFVDYVIEQLALLGRVTSRRMFGGVGLYCDGFFFALIGDDTLYFKVDDSNRADFVARGAKPFVPFPDKSVVSMNYYNVPADLLDDAEELCRWARKSVAVAVRVAALKAAPRKTKKKKVASSGAKVKVTSRPGSKVTGARATRVKRRSVRRAT